MSTINIANELGDDIDWKYWAQIPIVPMWIAAALACNIPPTKLVKFNKSTRRYFLDKDSLTIEELDLFQHALDISAENLKIELTPVKALSKHLNPMYDIQHQGDSRIIPFYMPMYEPVNIKDYIAFAKKAKWNCPKEFYHLKFIPRQLMVQHKKTTPTPNSPSAMQKHGRKMAVQRHKANREMKKNILDAYISQEWISKKEAAETLAKEFPRAKSTIINWLYAL